MTSSVPRLAGTTNNWTERNNEFRSAERQSLTGCSYLQTVRRLLGLTHFRLILFLFWLILSTSVLIKPFHPSVTLNHISNNEKILNVKVFKWYTGGQPGPGFLNTFRPHNGKTKRFIKPLLTWPTKLKGEFILGLVVLCQNTRRTPQYS